VDQHVKYSRLMIFGVRSIRIPRSREGMKTRGKRVNIWEIILSREKSEKNIRRKVSGKKGPRVDPEERKKEAVGFRKTWPY